MMCHDTQCCVACVVQAIWSGSLNGNDEIYKYRFLFALMENQTLHWKEITEKIITGHEAGYAV